MEREEEVADGEKGLVGFHLIIGSLSTALLGTVLDTMRADHVCDINSKFNLCIIHY